MNAGPAIILITAAPAPRGSRRMTAGAFRVMRRSCSPRRCIHMPVSERVDTALVRRIEWPRTDEGRQSLMWKEWLVTNGLGGYATGTLGGALTRRYDGLLVAALPTPFGRTVMLNGLWEQIRFPDGRIVPLHEVTNASLGR